MLSASSSSFHKFSAMGIGLILEEFKLSLMGGTCHRDDTCTIVIFGCQLTRRGPELLKLCRSLNLREGQRAHLLKVDWEKVDVMPARQNSTSSHFETAEASPAYSLIQRPFRITIGLMP